jgi:DNA (cytosine-5)-methyltransferase 1
MIKVVDIFAGPGGLGEGLSGFKDAAGRRRFELGISIEKDTFAHATLRLRAFRRQFNGRPPAAYERLIRGSEDWDSLAESCPAAARVAAAEALNIELGPKSVVTVRKHIEALLPRNDRWVLIGGPPCQAYSLVGRARNKGKKGYDPDEDHRQTLYVEYLQILADHAPPVFVMENVKGLLSAQVDRSGIFERIRADLRDPAVALRREGRMTSDRTPHYELRALSPASDIDETDPRRYLVRSELFGVPQRRHRVILVGIRSDIQAARLPNLLEHAGQVTVAEELRGLPRLRSGLSKTPDSDTAWREAVGCVRRKGWLPDVQPDVRRRIRDVVENLSVPAASRGSEVLDRSDGSVVLNHSTRKHIVADLDRYLFASSFGQIRGHSPVLAEYPPALLPLHANVRRAVYDAVFADRFRVQLAKKPSTTITSHISKDGHYYIHPDPSQCRSLTVREAARLQTFPDDYFFCGPRTEQYQQVGNAVPPRLAAQIAKAIYSLF